MNSAQGSPLGVVIVTYRSQDVIGDCLDSLLAAGGPAMRIVVVDNASSDGTTAVVAQRATRPGRHGVELIHAGRNGGYAAGVNLGLARLAGDPRISWFWVLNPDCTVPPETPARYLAALRRAGAFALMGGRTLYADRPETVQSDGGRVRPWTGVCALVNRGRGAGTPPPDAASLDFISGANMIASRAFLEATGPMREDYFLYYEEVDWAARRGGLPLRFCPEAVVHHRAGTAIGSPAPGRAASPFSTYFNYRGRMRFLARHRPRTLPTALVHALARALLAVLQRDAGNAGAILRGTLGLSPPRDVRDRLAPRPRSRRMPGNS